MLRTYTKYLSYIDSSRVLTRWRCHRIIKTVETDANTGIVQVYILG
jgi:hypothetical protein